MDRHKAKALLESGVLQAYAEGKAIQSQGEEFWCDVEDTLFSLPASYYRVKPAPRHDWVIEHRGGWWQVFWGITENAIKQHVQSRNAKGYRQLVPVTEEK